MRICAHGRLRRSCALLHGWRCARSPRVRTRGHARRRAIFFAYRTPVLAAQCTPGPCAPFLRACAAHAHTTTTKNDAATPACHRPMANAKKAAAMSEHVFTAEVVSVTTLATAPP